MNDTCEERGNTALVGLDMLKCSQEASGYGWLWTCLLIASIGAIALLYFKNRRP